MELRTGTYPTRFRLPVSYSTEIGRIITRWAHIEWQLKRIAYLLVSVDPKVGRLVVREPRIGDYVTMIEDLIKLKKLTVQSNLKELRSGLEQLEKNRDALAHGVWIKHPSIPVPVLQSVKGKWSIASMPKTKRKITPQGHPVTIQHLRNNAQSMVGAANIIGALETEISAQLSASPQKSSAP